MNPFPAGSNGGAEVEVDPTPNEVVSVSMLELVTKQLEEKFERRMSLQQEQFQKVEESLREEVASLKRELEEDREERSERGYYDDAIDILAEEMVRLEVKCRELEGRVEEFEGNAVQGRGQGAVVDFVPPFPVLGGGMVKVKNSSSANQLQLEKNRDSVGNNDDLFGREGEEEDDPSTDVDVQIIHVKAPTELVHRGVAVKKTPTEEAEVAGNGRVEAEPGPDPKPSTSRVGPGRPRKTEGPLDLSSPSSNTKGKHGRHPSRPLQCLCGKAYGRDGYLDQHLRYHSMRNRFPCNVCGKGFPFRCTLQLHMDTAKGHGHGSLPVIPRTQAPAVPVGPSPSVPEEGNRESQRGDRHAVGEKRLENGKPRFYCTCGRSYFKNDRLTDYIREMSVGKVFQCRLCPKRFSKHLLLQQHVKHTHKTTYWNKGKYVCSNCAGTFETMAELLGHRAAMHQGE